MKYRELNPYFINVKIKHPKESILRISMQVEIK